jgi:hypothetical protein
LPHGISTKEVLLQWAKKLQDRYTELNADLPGLSDDVVSHLRFMTGRIDAGVAASRRAEEGTLALREEIQELKKRDLEKSNVLEGYAKELRHCRSDRERLAQVLLKTVETLDGLKESEMSPRKRKAITAEIREGILEKNAISASESESRPSSLLVVPDANQNVPELERSAANWMLEDILLEFFKNGALQGLSDPQFLADLTCPNNIKKEKAKFRYSMELLSMCFDVVDWKSIAGDHKDNDVIEKATDAVRIACNDNARELMRRLELDSGLKNLDGAKDTGTKVKISVTGVGERFRKWKKEVGSNGVENTLLAKLKENGFMGSTKKVKRQSQLNFAPKDVPKNDPKKIKNPYTKK